MPKDATNRSARTEFQYATLDHDQHVPRGFGIATVLDNDSFHVAIFPQAVPACQWHPNSRATWLSCPHLQGWAL
jgi:hypothetical protein